ncbi:hypothetical protein LDENG_00164720 [Lucifuga dentata]|nr:hypothetical protein LDENG_00164720 [Lucifuga dentata]
MKTPVLQTSSNTKGQETVHVISSLCQVSEEAARVSPKMPETQVTINMMVVARRRFMDWQRGKIIETITKEDGRLKFKINFEVKGKSLVSGHHIAFDNVPNVEHLYIGARVVVRCQDNKSCYKPGILAELPGRNNRMRFLVFIDDHTPAYVDLPSLRLVCRPLKDTLDDISDNLHRNFMKEYLKIWPYPPMARYKVGQIINAEFAGVQKECQVEEVDHSLIQVVFKDDKHKEWIYRGSIRLELIIQLKEHLDAKQKVKQRDEIAS